MLPSGGSQSVGHDGATERQEEHDMVRLGFETDQGIRSVFSS